VHNEIRKSRKQLH